MAETKKNAKNSQGPKIHKPENVSKRMPQSFYDGQKKDKKPVRGKNGMIIPE